MPEVYFDVRWPDDSEMHCYSPSSVVHDYFRAGARYPLAEFLTLSRNALTLAGDRVEARFGFRCTSADSQLLAIETRARQFADHMDAAVTVLRVGRPGTKPSAGNAAVIQETRSS
ncbi:MSMEG_0570 family nitrogen starvation response protein [Alloalcanivorax mobilis]|uniref:MSMEG_0570 family nitrogen starvation response protein n=1 Tax=Alloalcanivorax mobilis TaxID=2019569 RepID=UPI000B5B3CFB|nr:MSMEG_0570 family nitrogen starvation response protein [Alloalcanivorax mobilis]ASK34413.1 hypothetical protein CEK62_08475 [Alcanivorax sp. N3-2A]|tara:strand:- start:9460 stop:9804 length:345 start_codon:yes stop_codon:yes gene_type:complete